MAAWSTQEPRKVTVYVRGMREEVDETAPFADTIKRLAQNRGLASFSVRVTETDGITYEVESPEDAPADFRDIERVDVTAYNKAA